MQYSRPWTLVLLIAALPAAQAADHGFYLGAAIGQTNASNSDTTSLPIISDDQDNGYKLAAGYRLFGALALEGDYVDYGRYNSLGIACAAVVGAPCPVDSRAKALRVSALGLLPVPFGDLYARVGVARWETDIRFFDGIGTTDFRDNGTDLTYGAGVQARLGSFAARLEYERTKMRTDSTIGLVSLGITYMFR